MHTDVTHLEMNPLSFKSPALLRHCFENSRFSFLATPLLFFLSPPVSIPLGVSAHLSFQTSRRINPILVNLDSPARGIFKPPPHLERKNTISKAIDGHITLTLVTFTSYIENEARKAGEEPMLPLVSFSRIFIFNRHLLEMASDRQTGQVEFLRSHESTHCT